VDYKQQPGADKPSGACALARMRKTVASRRGQRLGGKMMSGLMLG
jgi:hypothetical protein